MNEQDDAVALSGNRNKTSQTTVFRSIWQFAMDRFCVVELRGMDRIEYEIIAG